MHPDRHSYIGGIANSDNVILFINIINQLFLNKNSIQKLLEKRKEIAAKLEVFKNGNFVLEYNNIKFLNYNEEMKKVSAYQVHSYNAFCSGKALWQMERMVYDNCWV